MQSNLSKEQILNLARPFVDKLQSIADFYNDESNEQAYREWYLAKYGRYPESEVSA